MPHVVGLDIGTSAVRAAEVDTGVNPPALVAFGQIGLPPGSIIDGEVQDVSAVADAIDRLWRNAGFGPKSVVIGIAGLRAITREVDLPYVPDDEIDSAVRFQSEEVIPFPPDKTLLSAQVLADFAAPDGTTMRRVLVAAAHRDLVEGVVAAVERAGLRVAAVDLVSSALVRALVDSSTLTDQPEAVVSVGAGMTVVVVHENGRPQFVRTVGIGGNATTAAIASTLDLPLADAEALKRRLGEDSPQVQAVERAGRASVAELVGEIRNSIQYFASLPGRAPISKVLVTGGGSQLHGFVEALQAQVRIPVQVVSPLARLDLTRRSQRPEQLAAIDPVAATPVGLALPEPNPSVQKFNLIPPEVRERAFQTRIRLWSLVVAGILVLGLIGLTAYQYVRKNSAVNAITNLNNQVYQLQQQEKLYNKALVAKSELAAAEAQTSDAIATAVDWGAVLNELQGHTPSGFCGVNPSDPCFASFTGSSGAGAASPGATATPGSLGTITVGLSGVYKLALARGVPIADWLDDISGSPMFTLPSVSSATNTPLNPNPHNLYIVAFTSTVTLTKNASLAANEAQKGNRY